MTGTPEGFSVAAGGKTAARRFSFGSAILDERTLELTVQGEPVELEPKPLEVLRHLLAHAGEVVTKDEVLAAVWPGRILSETVLTKCIARLRDVLRDDEQQVIKTVHGYGYRLLAPVKVEAAAPPTVVPHFEFKAGDHPPLRPLWSLVKHLGQGSHGEAWLVQHDKTREQRVYKFAPDGVALHALKREITLYRLLHDAMGDLAPCIASLDWNLVEAPYFLELEYAAGGSLVDWAADRKGLAQVPMATRLEIAAQAAEALASAHSMGVLHKDLKPSNILIVSPPDSPLIIKLGDFGSGGVLDPARLEAMGITRMGFTQTIQAGTIAGSPLYIAPEVISGQPVTVQADIYSMGVILYQLIVGDLWRPMAPGWEQDIDDELLREDIAFAVEGHVERRLGTAAQLAQRLRALEQRRSKRAAERAAHSEATRQRRELQRMLARRGWVRATVAVLVIGLLSSATLSVVALRARDAAEQAAGTSKAVSDFLTQDMFAQVSTNKPLRNLTVKEVIDAAAERVPTRFAGRPLAQAQVHVALGASYMALDDAAAAQRELAASLKLADAHDTPGSETAVEAAAQLVYLSYALGTFKDEQARIEAQLAAGRRRLGEAHPGVLQLRNNLAVVRIYLGPQQQAAAELRSILSVATGAPNPDLEFIGETEANLGLALVYLAEYTEATKMLGPTVTRLEARLGPNNIAVASARLRYAVALISAGRYPEADAELSAGLAAASHWTPSDAAALVQDLNIAKGRLRLEQDRLEEAERILEATLEASQSWAGPELDFSFHSRAPLAEIYQRTGRLREAESQIRLALEAVNRAYGPDNERAMRYRIMLADILREQGRIAEAWAEVRGFDPAPLMAFPRHPGLAELRRQQGLLYRAEGKHPEADKALAESLDIVQFRYGEPNWRTLRARAEITAADRPTRS